MTARHAIAVYGPPVVIISLLVGGLTVLCWPAIRAVRLRRRKRDVPAYAVAQWQQFQAEEAERRIRAYEAELAAARQRMRAAYDTAGQALAEICDPCHGRRGATCICTEKCESRLCAAVDTDVMFLSPDDVQWLRSIDISGGEI